MTKQFTTFTQRQGRDINGVRPVMIPDDAGEWVSRHDAEHLAEQLTRAQQQSKELKSILEREREKSRRVMSRSHQLEASLLAVKLPAVPVATVDIKRGNPNGIFSIYWHHAALSQPDGTYRLFAIPAGE